MINKNLSKLRIEVNFLYLIKNKQQQQKDVTKIILNNETVKLSPLDWEQSKNAHCHHFYSTLYWQF